MPKGNRAHKSWPIRSWQSDVGEEHIVGFIVEDDQGYNFSFPTREEAEGFRSECLIFRVEMEKREGELIRQYREHLRA